MEQPILNINGRYIGGENACFIIAEIGQNHQGDIIIAKNLIDIAKESGADCVKFQKSCLEEKFTKDALSAEYQSLNSWGKTYGEHKAFLEFSEEQYLELKKYSESKGIWFTASAMDTVSLQHLVKLKVPFIKIGSGDSSNLLLIEEAAKTGIPLIISTGMQNLAGVIKVKAIVNKFHDKVAFLHCVSAYPTPLEHANLRAITTLKREFPASVIGYSGHEIGYNITLAAVALGAKIVERHITLNKSWKGSDHCCSLEPFELKALVKGICEIELSLGTGVKEFQLCEESCRLKLGKVIVSARNLSPGTILKIEHIKVKVVGSKVQKCGIPPDEVFTLVGKTLTKNVLIDEPIERKDFE